MIAPSSRSRRRDSGFSLIEMIIVITISAVIGVVMAMVIRRPVDAIDDQMRRTQLVDLAESALRRMQRDVRASLPNTVRLRTQAGTTSSAVCTTASGNTICSVELLHTIDGGRYRLGTEAAAPGPCNVLNLTGADTSFDVMGTLQNFASIDTTNHWIVINNTSLTAGDANNAYEGNNRASISPTAAGCPATSATHIDLDGFAFASPGSTRHRFFVVDTPVTFQCNLTTGTLRRYRGYTIVATQPSTPVGGTSAVLAQMVTGCSFSYQDGANARAGLLTLDLTLQDPNRTNESIRLLHQVHVYNTP